MNISRKQQSGFTLIELVMVIVILGILAVVAIPQYVDLTTDANQSAVNGVAGALAAANMINYATRSENSTNGISVSNCTDLSGALQGGTAGSPIAAGNNSYVIGSLILNPAAPAIPAGPDGTPPATPATPAETASCVVNLVNASGATIATANFPGTGIK